MIDLKAPGGRFRVVVLATAEVDRIKSAAPILTPDKTLLVAWTPDPEWLLDRIRTGAGTSNDIGRAIDEASRRPEAGMLLGADGNPLPALLSAQPSANGTHGVPIPDAVRIERADLLIRSFVAAINTADMNESIRSQLERWLLDSGKGTV